MMMFNIAILFAVTLSLANCSSVEQDISERIIGGTVAPDGAFPYQVALREQSFDLALCGGSIISPEWILTAGSCFKLGDTGEGTIIEAGTNLLNSNGARYNISQVIHHPLYTQSNDSILHDMALLRVAGTIVLEPKVQPIKLACRRTAAGTKAVLTGWGATQYPLPGGPDQSIAVDLQYGNFTTISYRKCAKALDENPHVPAIPVVPKFQLCASQGVGKGACGFDAGNPLVRGDVQIGVITWVTSCGRGMPDVFTSVYPYRRWIREVTGV